MKNQGNENSSSVNRILILLFVLALSIANSLLFYFARISRMEPTIADLLRRF